MEKRSDFFTTKEAAFIFGCSEVHARRILIYADDREELGNGKFRSLYLKCRVLKKAQERECEKNNEKLREKGLRSCRSCGEKFHCSDMISGKCNQCRANDICKNFLCHGDCFKCPIPDLSLLDFLKNAVAKYE